jgi:hypothetical protein
MHRGSITNEEASSKETKTRLPWCSSQEGGKKAEKEDADTLAYISQAICSAG